MTGYRQRPKSNTAVSVSVHIHTLLNEIPKSNQFTSYSIPPNIEFVIEDIEDDWIYPDNTFDFIHSRFLASAIKDMPRLISQAFRYLLPSPRLSIILLTNAPAKKKKKQKHRCTKPNAWVEFQDIDLMMHSSDDTLKGTAMERYYTELVQAFEEAGYCTRPGPELEKWFREIGFVDIHVTRYYVPMGTWPKDEHLVRCKHLKFQLMISSTRRGMV